MSTTVSYKGNTIATLNNETKTLTTGGTWVEADIQITDTSSGGSGTGAISVVDTTDSHGGTIRTITGLDISDTTAVASDVAQGKYFYTADGTKTAGTSSGGGSSNYTRTTIAAEQTVTPTSNGTYLAATLNTSAFESGADYIITYNGTEYFYTCTVMWSTNYVLGDINYFYGNTGYPYPFGIIWMSGTTCTLACGDSTAVTVKIEKLELIGDGLSSQTITGTVTGSGTTTLEIPCSFEPDLVYIYADLSDDVSLRGVVSLTILKDIALYMTSDGSQNAIQESMYAAIHGISSYNENNQNDEPYASYSNGVLSINTAANTSMARFASGISYSYKLVGASSITQHTIYFEFSDSTDTTITAYYDSTFISDAITATTPTTYGQKTVTLAQLDGVTWYETGGDIPLNTELVDYTKVMTEYAVQDSGVIENTGQSWDAISDYIPIDPSMTFTFKTLKWYRVGFYNSSKNVVRVVSGSDIETSSSDNVSTGTLNSSNIPSTAAYIILSGNAYNLQGTMSLIRTS